MFHGRGKNFAVGNVAIAAANHGRNSLNAEIEIGAGPFQGFHSWLELFVIERADVEVKIFKSLGAHSRKLRHRWRRPAQNTPFGFFHPLVLNRLHFFGDQFHLVHWHIG